MGFNEQPENSSMVDTVVRAMQSLNSDANFKIVSELITDVYHLRDKNARLTTSKREMFEEYRSFRNELEDEEKKLKEEKEALERQVEEKDSQIAELNDAKTQLTEAKSSLEAQLDEKEKDLASVTEAKTGLEADKASLEAKIAEKEEELTELNDAKSKLTEEKTALESTVEEKTKELATLGDEKTALESSLADKIKEVEGLTEDKTKLTEEKAALGSTVAEKDKDLESLQAEKSTLIEEKQALESKVSEKEQELASLQDVKSKLESDLAEVTEAKSKLETELTEANTKIEEQTRKAEADAEEIQSLKATIDERNTELTGVKDELATMTTTADEAKSRGDTLEAELNDMTAKHEEKAARVETLEGEVGDLTKKVEDATTHISTLEGELKDMTERADERAARIEVLDEELSSMTTTANEAKARIDFLETELGVVTGKAEQLQTDLSSTKTDLDNTRQDLEGKNSRLTELDSYRVPLLSDHEDTYVQILDTIWTSIASLVETQFRQDLDQSVLTDESCWANLRQSEYLKHARQIPLPNSNSPAAKQMRVAAVLAVLSRALHRYIFRPVYLTDSGVGDDGMVHMLRAIACDNSTREEHTRATLLAMLPEKQKSAAAKRISTVVREVSWSVQHLLSALQYEAFCTGLEAACKLACLQWMRIQMAQMKIEPYFGPPYDDYDWQVLPLPAFEGSADEGVHLHGDCDDQEGAAVIDDNDDVVVEVGRPVEDTPLSGGGRVVDPEDQKSFRSSSRQMTDYDGDSEVGPDEIMLVVWPSMCALENGELESITQGLVISKDQVRAASDEVRGRGRQRPTTKRARTLSMPGRGVSGSAGKTFLQPGGDGGESTDG